MDNFDAGTNPSPDVSSGGTADQTANQQVAEPAVIDVDDNALIRIKGQDKPVKFGEYGRGFQSQFTKASQRAAQLERELSQERELRQRFEQERQRASATQTQTDKGDVFAALRALPYLSGEDAAQVVGAIAKQIEERDQVQRATLQYLKQMQGVVNQLQSTHVNSSFESKIDRWLTENNWSPDLKDLAKEVYLAYEGNDLDDEFPRIFGARVDQMRRAFEAERTAKIRASKPNPFVPGKGGHAGPSKPLDLKASASSKEIADQLWGTLQGTDT